MTNNEQATMDFTKSVIARYNHLRSNCNNYAEAKAQVEFEMSQAFLMIRGYEKILKKGEQK